MSNFVGLLQKNNIHFVCMSLHHFENKFSRAPVWSCLSIMA